MTVSAVVNKTSMKSASMGEITQCYTRAATTAQLIAWGKLAGASLCFFKRVVVKKFRTWVASILVLRPMVVVVECC